MHFHSHFVENYLRIDKTLNFLPYYYTNFSRRAEKHILPIKGRFHKFQFPNKFLISELHDGYMIRSLDRL